MGVVEDLVAARNAAIDRGDKALGREIYHQLQVMGVRPDVIDAAAEAAPAPPKRERAVKPPTKHRATPKTTARS